MEKHRQEGEARPATPSTGETPKRPLLSTTIIVKALEAGVSMGYAFGVAKNEANHIAKGAMREIRDLGTGLTTPDASEEEHQSVKGALTVAALTGLAVAGKIVLGYVGEHLTSERPDGQRPSPTAMVLGTLATTFANGIKSPDI